MQVNHSRGAWVQYQVSPCEICGGQGGAGLGFVVGRLALEWDLWWAGWRWNGIFHKYFGFFPLYFPPKAPYSFSFTLCSYQKDKRAKLEDLPNISAVSEFGEHWKATAST
jgi:hypothetical protein